MSTAKHMHREAIGVNDATLHYLDIVYRLTFNGEAANTSEIAKRLGVTPSGASVMLKRLSERKLVQLTPYKGATLTQQGRRIALRTIRRHRLLEMFLVQVMHFAWHEVDEHAHTLETSINDAFEERMDLMLGHPTRCPHGHLIPARDGTLPKVADVPLLDMPIGTSGVIRCVDSDESDLLKYVGEQGLMPGTQFSMRGIAPYGGPVMVETEHGILSLGLDVAGIIFAEII
ncbi:MAG: metal-dependent transcriptional regulator [Chloroflexi bacterium]|nr:metal-dependent transcriptional regulator [Chloroflexota bacterium]